MPDTLGWRAKFGVITPSTNTVVGPEYDAMAPRGVTNHVEGMFIPDDPVATDADFEVLLARIDAAMENAIDRVMTSKPDHVILGISSESIWNGGLEAARDIERRVGERTGGIAITQAAYALPAALKAYGVRERIALVTPYFPVAEEHIRSYVAQIGFNAVRMYHLSCKSPVLIAHTTEKQLRDAMWAVDGDDIEAIVQFGANLPNARVAAEAERWLEKPVICINVCTYWHALRSAGINDAVPGFGRLLSDF